MVTLTFYAICGLLLLFFLESYGYNVWKIEQSRCLQLRSQGVRNSQNIFRLSQTSTETRQDLQKIEIPSSQNEIQNIFNRIIDQGTNLFPVWVLSFSLLGFYFPHLFKWFVPFITPALMFTMLGMGMTLTIGDFKRVLHSWPYILVGFFAQYIIMPLTAYTVTKLFPLDVDIASGLILVGCAPGGTASNLVTLIARGDIPLSILMTTVSTVAAVFMTPLLVTKIIGKSIQLNSMDLVYSTMNVVLLPVLLGLFINTNFSSLAAKVSQFTPFLSVLLVACICGSISSLNHSILQKINGIQLITSIVLLHAMGFFAGYLFAKFFKANENQARTIRYRTRAFYPKISNLDSIFSIETGMQNSALAVVLAKHFPNPILSALPGAISATCHSLLGSILAALWRKYDNRKSKQKELPSV